MEFCFEGCEIIAESVDPLQPRRSRPPSPPVKERRLAKKDAAVKEKDAVVKETVVRKPSEKRPLAEKGSASGSASKSSAVIKRKGSEEDPSVRDSKKKKPVSAPSSGKGAVSAPPSGLQLAPGGGEASTGARSASRATGSGGFIWEHGLVENFPDSVGMYLPGHDQIRDAQERPEGLGSYSRELFRAVELPYMREEAKKDPLGAVESVMGHLFEAGAVMGHIYDDLAAREGKLEIRDVGADKIKELVVAKNHQLKRNVELRNLLEAEKRKVVAATKSLEIRETEVLARDECLKAANAELDVLGHENDKLKAEVKALKSRQADFDRLFSENVRLQAELADAGPRVIREFLGSRGFKCAAQEALIDSLRYTIYGELTKLSEVYPFIPEQLGYASVERSSAIPKDLSSYSWDAQEDKLRRPNGEEVPTGLSLPTLKPSPILYCWDKGTFPTDVTKRSPAPVPNTVIEISPPSSSAPDPTGAEGTPIINIEVVDGVAEEEGQQGQQT